MYKDYWKTAWRNLVKNKVHSFINIAGLSVGMAVAMLIGLWMYDEICFNRNFDHYDRIAQVMQHQTFNGDVVTQTAVPYLMGEELKKDYGSDFKAVTMASWTNNRILSYGEKTITKSGNFFEPQVIEMLSLKMVEGTRDALTEPESVILSVSTAKALFGNESPMGKLLKIDNRFDVKVTGVYADLAYNSDFKNLSFIAPWKLFIDGAQWQEKATNPWRNNSFQAYVQLADHADMQKVSSKIRDARLRNVTPADAAFKPIVFLQPMTKWHLYAQFKNGWNTGGRIEFVWLFGIIGFFVLLLACINFMNLSTARSEKRAKEVGIRKAIGSRRGQLIRQFYAESLLVAAFSFVVSLIFVQLTLPFFNPVADKQIAIPWEMPLFWTAGVFFTVFTGCMAGSYPALYLSAFNPVKVLKGTFRAGRYAALPRKMLVIVQFTVSVILIIGTVVVFKQIQFAKDRPVGYSRAGLISVDMVTENIHDHFDAVASDLKRSGAIAAMAESSSATYYVNETDNGFTWEGKAPSLQGDFDVVYVSRDFGKTIGWNFEEGRDFSNDFPTDSSGIILNEAAVKFMGLPHPVGKTINWDGNQLHVIGVVKDMVMQSPYEPVFRTVFVTNRDPQEVVDIRIHPNARLHDVLSTIEAVFRKYNPQQPFEYHFSDEEYAKKFGDEDRLAELASFFAVLAIFISCLGLFGMASFMAEQRAKEIGVRKVLGASVMNVWQLVSKDFLVLVGISFVVAAPVADYLMVGWLKRFQYQTGISWWIFAATGVSAAIITLLTVSFQAIRAAMADPVTSLRSE